MPFLRYSNTISGPWEIKRWPIYSAGSRALIFRTHRNTAVRDFFLHVLVAALKGHGLDYLQWFRPADLTCQDCLMHVNYQCKLVHSLLVVLNVTTNKSLPHKHHCKKKISELYVKANFKKFVDFRLLSTVALVINMNMLKNLFTPSKLMCCLVFNIWIC